MWDVLTWILAACGALLLLCVLIVIGVFAYAVIKTELEMRDGDNEGGDDNGDD